MQFSEAEVPVWCRAKCMITLFPAATARITSLPTLFSSSRTWIPSLSFRPSKLLLWPLQGLEICALQEYIIATADIPLISWRRLSSSASVWAHSACCRLQFQITRRLLCTSFIWVFDAPVYVFIYLGHQREEYRHPVPLHGLDAYHDAKSEPSLCYQGYKNGGTCSQILLSNSQRAIHVSRSHCLWRHRQTYVWRVPGWSTGLGNWLHSNGLTSLLESMKLTLDGPRDQMRSREVLRHV